MTIAHLSLDDLKDQALRLRQEMALEGSEINHARALEIVAHQLGYKDWNTLHALVGNRPPGPPISVGQTVTGKFMGQPFIADVLGIRAVPNSGRFHISLQLDEAIDVVTFDSFSNFRKRVSCTIDKRGKSGEKLSNGHRHMVLDL